MLGWAITYFVIAIIAGLLGFTGIAGAAVGIAKVLFFLFLVLFVVFLIFGRRAAPPLYCCARERNRSVFIRRKWHEEISFGARYRSRFALFGCSCSRYVWLLFWVFCRRLCFLFV